MIEIREAKQTDYNCIYATWLRSYRHGALFPRHIPEKIYYARHHDVIERLLRTSKALVATTPEEPTVILGWAVFQPEIQAIHYVYVKPAFRRAGVASRLLFAVPLEGAMYSHETFALRENGLASKLLQSVYNPYLAMQPNEPGASNGR